MNVKMNAHDADPEHIELSIFSPTIPYLCDNSSAVGPIQDRLNGDVVILG